MPIFRTWFAKVKPGRMPDAVTQLAAFRGVALESGATHVGAFSIITGPLFPGLMIGSVYDNLTAFGEAREQVRQRPEARALFGDNAPIEVVNALLSESVYMAGDPPSIIGQTKVRYSIVVKPNRGRGEDVARRASRLADTAHQCGALAASVRRVIAGTAGPRIVLHAFHAGYAEWEATRKAVMASEFMQAFSRSQDEAAVRMQTIVATRVDL